MGAGQSSTAGAASTQEAKTSYYELLSVHRQATEEEIKKAYRRKALELHPDRNFGNEEAATKTFAEIQAAYEVLSDPQERSWYDSHESAILRGEDASDTVPTYENVRVTTADDLVRLVRKFNSNVEFSDGPSGFFGFLRETFDQLAKEEVIAADWDNLEPSEFPTFGHRDDTYDDVVKSFYAAWSSFVTVKTFAWKDLYRLSEAPDRWTRRRMEQENNRSRQEGKREFNEAVRSLVAFVKKRDPRYVPSSQTEEERQKVLRDATAAQAARARAANEAKLGGDVPEWTKFREPDELEESEEEEIEQEVLECVACNKIFKSERQWEAHEKSKKHQKAVKQLQQKMRKENANFDLEASMTSTPEADKADNDSEGDLALEAADEYSGSIEHSEQGDVDRVETHSTDLDSHGSENGHLDNRDNESAPKQYQNEDTASADSQDEDYASLETIQARMNTATLDSTPTLSDSEETKQSQKPKVGKAKQKRAKKAMATPSADQSDAQYSCDGCNQGFPSKTRLFDHLKANPKHASLKLASAGKGKKGKR